MKKASAIRDRPALWTHTKRTVGTSCAVTVTPQGDGSHVTWDVDTDDHMVEMMQGYLGQPEGGWPKVLQKIILDSAGAKPLKGRPGAKMPKVDFEQTRKELAGKIGRDGLRAGIVMGADSLALAELFEFPCRQHLYGGQGETASDGRDHECGCSPGWGSRVVAALLGAAGLVTDEP